MRPDRDPLVTLKPAANAVVGGRLIVYPFSVRRDIFAKLKVPADLTVDEAERMSAFLKAIALARPESAS